MMNTVKPDQQDNYEVQDKPDFLDTKFFKGDKLSKDGLLFESNISLIPLKLTSPAKL